MRDKKHEMKEEKEVRRFVLAETGTPWEIGPGFLRVAGASRPVDDDRRARITGTILSGAEEITEEEALRISAELDEADR